MTIFIRAGWLLDGSGAPPRTNVLLKLRNGRIADIHPWEKDALKSAPQTEIIDLSQCTLLPPLVDCHVHLSISGTSDRLIREAQLTADYDTLEPFMGEHLTAHFHCGVRAVRDGGDRGAFALRFRDQSSFHEKIPVQIMVAGKAWHQAGRYGRLIGRAPDADDSLSRAIDRDTTSGDQIKIVNSGLNSLVTFGKQTPPQFNADEMRAAVVRARHMGRKVMVHANGRMPVEIAVKAGCDSIEHGFFMGADNLALMAETGTVWIPTAVTMEAYATIAEAGTRESEGARRNLAHQMEQLAMARRLGVTVAIGTDAGSPGVHHGTAVREEMCIFIRSGYRIEEAVRCATHNGAQLLGLEDSGLLQRNKRADFIAVQGPPECLPESLKAVQALFIDGSAIKVPFDM